MAKLTARGRKELIRLTQEEETPNDPNTIKRRTTVALMDDGKVLRKYDVIFRATTYSREERHSYGWKQRGSIRVGATIQQFLEWYTMNGYRLTEISAGVRFDVPVRGE